ncbi:MAG: glycosyltransferase [Methanobacteriaceae archaeon]|nr:glycosyltransferase [Methanobacteriaceae archaeon]
MTNNNQKSTNNIKHITKIINESNLFNKEYYLETNGDVKQAGVDPLQHYIKSGYKEGRNPSDNFDNNFYIENNPDVKKEDINPLYHYLTIGKKEGRTIRKTPLKHQMEVISDSGLFDSEYYLENYTDIKEANLDPLEHYTKNGFKEQRSPSLTFSNNFYININKYVKENNINPLYHYITVFKEEQKRKKDLGKQYHQKITSFDVKQLKKEYDIIKNSTWFDTKWYLKNNPYIEKTHMNPIMHYILFGADNGFDPHPFFSTNKYLKKNGDIKKEGINPLAHYISYGLDEGRNAYVSENYPLLKDKYSFLVSKNITEKLETSVTIIIPIYNAYEETKECITSVLNNTNGNYKLILINDCSTDKRINELLDSLENINNIKIIHNNKNQGFVKNVNLGINEANNEDVIILNSDTIVTPRWLTRFIKAAYTENKIGTVTPYSNSTDIGIKELAPSKDTLTLNKNAYKLDKLSTYGNMEAPTGNGFCIYIKRDLIKDIGIFDEIFDKGYGEETDFTTRAKNNGWKNIRNESIFVYHKRHASFKKENTDKLKKENQKILRKRHPQVFSQWDEFVKSEQLQNSLKNIKKNINTDIKERILYVTSLKENNLLKFDDKFKEIESDYDSYILNLNKDEIQFFGKKEEKNFIIKELDLKNGGYDQYLKVYFNLLNTFKIDLIVIPYLKEFYHPDYNLQSSFITLSLKLGIPSIYLPCILDQDIKEVITNKLNPNKELFELINLKKSNIDFNKKSLVVYTALTGNYDSIPTPKYINENLDYICFTDNPSLKSNFWTIKQMEDLDLDPIRKARHYKILPHKYLEDYDYSIWIDSNFVIENDITRYINTYSTENKLLCISHDQRDCLYEEAECCIELKKDDPELIQKQIMKYYKEGYPSHNGLISSGILFRNHHDKQIINTMNTWYEEVINYSRRDQLSFNYACWKNNTKYDLARLFYFRNEYFQRELHYADAGMNLNLSQDQVSRILEQLDKKVSIIIPIYNAFKQTKTCIESVQRNTHQNYELILINDCSTDEQMKPYLDDLSKIDNIKVIHNKTNKGFVKNVNIGINNTSNDIILLNSDTVVTPNWLSKLIISAYTEIQTGTVTPLSNNSGAFSVPIIGKKNEINPELGIDNTSKIIENIQKHPDLEVPTGNGFCMYIKRAAIYSVGFFDENFGKGYCEENDFCMRLIEHNWNNKLTPTTYIYHDHNASFKEDKEKLLKENRKYLDYKHPTYTKTVKNFVQSIDYANIRENIDLTLNCKQVKEYAKKRILYVIHEGTGGTLHTTSDLIQYIQKDYDVYLLTAGHDEIRLHQYNNYETKFDTTKDNEFKKNFTTIANWKVKSYYSIKEMYIPEYARIYFNVLNTLKIDLIHIRHLIHHTFDLPCIGKKLDIPIVMSFHDFYYICPAHFLVDDQDNYCAGTCSNVHITKEGETLECNVSKNLNTPNLKTFVHKWREMVSEMFKNCQIFITTSPYARQLYTKIYPELKNKEFKIIEHGRDLTTPNELTDSITIPSKDKPIKILFPGHIGIPKGGKLIENIKNLDIDSRLEFHFLGGLHGELNLEQTGEYHGFYERSNFCKEVNKIKPSFIGIFSIWPETYCHTLTEALSCGIPVLTLNIGATGERINRDGGGWFIENQTEKAYNKIIEISENTDKYLETVNKISDIKFKSVKEMSDEYKEVYQNIIDEKREYKIGD